MTRKKLHTQKKMSIGIAVAIVLVIVLTIAYENAKSDNLAVSDTTTVPVDTTKQTPIATVPSTTTSTYKDGTYTATGSYMSPGGPDKIGVTVTLANNIVTDVSVTPEPGDHTSSHYQGIFAANYKQYVVGQNIATLHLTKVSGSSLTPKGFDDAIAQIKTQAQA
jgi:uncharacterized protein with FMN-binding domain